MILSPELVKSNGFTLVPNSTACFQRDGLRVCFYSWNHMIASVGMDHYMKGENLTVEQIEIFYTDITGNDLCIYSPSSPISIASE